MSESFVDNVLAKIDKAFAELIYNAHLIENQCPARNEETKALCIMHWKPEHKHRDADRNEFE